MLAYTSHVAKNVQISIDEELLREVDRQPEAKRNGRSAYIRNALRSYMNRQRELAIDAAYEAAYRRSSNEVYEEFKNLLGSQAWPEEK
jgi:metal-responsive CopG/Arc/MetJ family transcriptional regulator